MKEAYYFSHDSNAHNDPKILSMICDYGMAGYGRFWVIIENLREQSEFKLKHDKGTWKALAMQMQCTPEEVKQYIHDCVYEYALLEITEDLYFSSNSLNRRMGKYLNEKQKKVDAANKRWGNAKDMQSTCNASTPNIQNDANEIKLNEIKLNEIKDVVTPEKFYNTNFGPITRFIADDINNFINDGIEEALIVRLMQEALKNGANNWNYVSAAIVNLSSKNITTLELYEAHEASRKRSGKKVVGINDYSDVRM